MTSIGHILALIKTSLNGTTVQNVAALNGQNAVLDLSTHRQRTFSCCPFKSPNEVSFATLCYITKITEAHRQLCTK